MALVDNIVAYYEFEGNANDATPNGNNGTATSITYSTTAGKIDEGASFNGSTSFIDLPSGIYGLFNGTNNWTINAWINLQVQPTGGAERTIYNSTSNTSQNFQRWNAHFHLLDTNGSGTATKLAFYRADGTSVIGSIIGSTTLSTATWYMATVTYDGSNIRLYLNASSDATAVSSTGSASTGANGRFGKAINSGSSINYWNGYQDEVGFWSRALTTDEITELYNSGAGLQYPFTPPIVTETETHTLNSLLYKRLSEDHSLDTLKIKQGLRNHTVDALTFIPPAPVLSAEQVDNKIRLNWTYTP